MPSIQESVQKHQELISEGKGTPARSVPENSPILPEPANIGQLGPSRGSFVPGQVLDTDIAKQNIIGTPERSRMFPIPSNNGNNNAGIQQALKSIVKASEASVAQTVASFKNTPVATTDPSTGLLTQTTIGQSTPLPFAPPERQIPLDNVSDGFNFKRLLNVDADNTFHISTSLNNQGSVIGNSSGTLSYTSTTTSITFSWTAFTCPFSDGSTLNITSGTAPSFTGLTASTTYHFGAYVLKSDSSVHIIMSDNVTSAGSLTWAVQTIGADGHIIMGDDFTASTPASGSGGGSGGGGGNCFSGDVRIKTADGFMRMDELPDEFDIENMTGQHHARIIRHPVSDEILYNVPSGGLVTYGHLIKQNGGWVSAGEIFTRNEVVQHIPLYDIHVETGLPDDMHYILENGYIAHNKSRVSCFSGNTLVRTPQGWIRFDKLPEYCQIENADGIFNAVLFRHKTDGKGRFCRTPSGSIVTDDHLIRLRGINFWKHADELFPLIDEIPNEIFNLAVCNCDYFETFDVLAHDRDA